MTIVPYTQRGTVQRLATRTPLDWRDLLAGRLVEQKRTAQAYEAYYEGEHPLQFATPKFREAFGNLFSAFADNWCQIVVDAPVERLKVIGFQVGGSPSEEAWAIWQRNGLDVESVVAHTEAGKSGRAYLLVDPNGGDPQITVEHSGQMYVATDPANRRRSASSAATRSPRSSSRAACSTTTPRATSRTTGRSTAV